MRCGVFFFQAEDGIRDGRVTGVQTCALPISLRGTFSAFNSTFTLTEGRATFAEIRGTTPYVDARAETTIQVVTLIGSDRRIDPVRVFVHVYGTPDELVVDLTSDPTLPQDRILAGLAGRVGVTRLMGGTGVQSVLP